jgi:hypothetical protein
MFSSQSSGAVNAVVNGAVNAVSDVASGAANAVSDAANAATSIFNSVNKAANTAANNISKNSSLFNSLIPLGNSSSGPSANSPKNGNAPKNGNGNAPKNTGNNSKNMNLFGNDNSKGNNGAKNSPNTPNSPANASAKSSLFSPVYIFFAVVIVFVGLFSFFNSEITQGYEYVAGLIKMSLNYPTSPDVIAPIQPIMPIQPVTSAPQAPQDMTPDQAALPQVSHQSIIERILPQSSDQEVFNVAQNKFTFYDAEPLCNALGAELATYEQVKDAWNNGADWCNYGWVKGQMAIYPTQKGTYEKLQSGPADERNACGTVGINGGYFDNPEFKYGVNCYGKKPPQSAHDQEQLMSQGKVAKSPETLKVDKMVAQYKEQADSLFVKPFNDNKWEES